MSGPGYDELNDWAEEDRFLRDQEREEGVALVEAVRTLLWLAFNRRGASDERAKRLGAQLEQVASSWGADELQAMLTYVVSVFGPESELMDLLFESASKEARHMYTTMRDRLLAEGMELGRSQGMALGRMEGMELGRSQGIERGRAEGIAGVLERILLRRGLSMTEEQRLRIRGCGDPQRLQQWVDRAITAQSVAEVLVD
ncbi:MAG: hypothetical protein H6712_03285 [Myxococcales bacterium]|nr:hypothetical protein [Myxococcales bacterium]MCB9712850.1 hypothetical protein [Myxococcales bacterium]